MTRLGAFTAGALTATFLAVIPVLLFAAPHAPVLSQPGWSLLAGGAVIVTGLSGGLLGLYVTAYRDRAAEVTGYCRPVREKVR